MAARQGGKGGDAGKGRPGEPGKGKGKGEPGEFLKRMDKNNDGAVSKEEMVPWAAVAAAKAKERASRAARMPSSAKWTRMETTNFPRTKFLMKCGPNYETPTKTRTALSASKNFRSLIRIATSGLTHQLTSS